MKRVTLLFVKALFVILLFAVVQQMVSSSLDIYNNFAYDKAILRYTPYGYVPLLDNPNDYHSSNAEIKGGAFVYVENWESADNGSVVFAKVRSKFSTGYVNNRMLVEANLNVMPIFSVVMLVLIFVFTVKKVYSKIHNVY
ncbi:MAG TPA: hypothetical protein PK605_07855 [Ignavibacteria bacterium]|nr:hypothetical protein [Bacteroidota bacterium]HRE12035.1 hypothetical protein [Ignavibacteria bacterium]HRF64739.1 hypothetical protein [Ignavibacteria bacterium]HRJ04302.1 hypothetical protein [Ignavibacteria bacterium]